MTGQSASVDADSCIEVLNSRFVVVPPPSQSLRSSVAIVRRRVVVKSGAIGVKSSAFVVKRGRVELDPACGRGRSGHESAPPARELLTPKRPGSKTTAPLQQRRLTRSPRCLISRHPRARRRDSRQRPGVWRPSAAFGPRCDCGEKRQGTSTTLRAERRARPTRTATGLPGAQSGFLTDVVSLASSSTLFQSVTLALNGQTFL